MYKSYIPYLQHILDECLYIRSAISDEMQMEEFLRDETLKRAVTRSLTIIGEATKKIPADVKYAWQGISWRQMAGMRDRLVHDYMGVNYYIVWDVATSIITEAAGYGCISASAAKTDRLGSRAYPASINGDMNQSPVTFPVTLSPVTLEETRAKNFQRMIVQRLKEMPSQEYQLIFATSNIADELNTPEYTIGEYYTQSNKSLKNVN